MERFAHAWSHIARRTSLAAACGLALLVPAVAGAQTHEFAPVKTTHAEAVFAPRGVDPESVVSAHVVVRSGHERDVESVSRGRVRQALRSGSKLHLAHHGGKRSHTVLQVRGRRYPKGPDTTITSGPSGTINTGSASFSYASSVSGSTFECRLDGTGWATCPPPEALSSLADGSHVFDVRAVDSSGLTDQSPASRSFTVQTQADTTAPDTTITSGPSGTISSNSTSFSFASTESSSSFECRLDGAGWASCSSPKSLSSLGNGSHTFDVRATDAAGNTDQSPASGSFTVQVTTTPSGTSCSWGSFSAGSMPGSCWRPYSDSSPFNRLVPGSPRLASNSSAMVSKVLSFGPAAHMVGGVADTSDDWGQPIYFSQPSDPVYTVHCTKSWGTCEVEGMQVRIPSAARPAGGGDAHMAVIDQAGGWEYDFWQVQSKPAGGGTITISWGGRTAIGTSTADGLGSNATAGHFGLAAGLIRLEELRDMQINHALAMVVNCTNGTSVWPAESGTGRSCSSIGLSNADAPAMGQHFYLAMSDAEINALAVPQWKKAILFALAHYGAFVRDTGGGSWGFSGESGSSYTSFGKADPWVTLGDLYGVPKYPDPNVGPQRIFNIRDGVDWTKLRAVDPCVAQGTC